jgi:hypothetical protein
MGPEHPLEFCSDSSQRRPRVRVAKVRVKADALDAPLFEGVGKHELLHLGVGGSPDGGASETRASDLPHVWTPTSVQGMGYQPWPVPEVPEPGRADNGLIPDPDHDQGHRRARFFPGECSVDVNANSGLSLGHQRPSAERWVGDQARAVAGIEGLEPNVLSAYLHWPVHLSNSHQGW